MCERCQAEGFCKRPKASFWAQVLGSVIGHVISTPVVAMVGWGARIVLAVAVAVCAAALRSKPDPEPEPREQTASSKSCSVGKPLAAVGVEKGAERLVRLSR